VKVTLATEDATRPSMAALPWTATPLLTPSATGLVSKLVSTGPKRRFYVKSDTNFDLGLLVPPGGLEPPTNGLKVG